MIERSKHDVYVEAFVDGSFDDWAVVNGRQFPDGSPKNSLTPDGLRDVASMINDVADEMEEHQNHD